MKIRIDRSTIRKNPNAGSTSTPLFGRVSTTAVLECVGALPYAVKAITNTSGISFSDGVCRYNVHVSEDVDKLTEVAKKHNVKVVSYTQDRPVQLVAHPPESAILYSHEDTKVRCVKCDKEFSVRQLGSDSMMEDDSYNDCVCPFCDAWDCCEVTYEKLSDIPKEELRECLIENSKKDVHFKERIYAFGY
jgi:hypothetical protein